MAHSKTTETAQMNDLQIQRTVSTCLPNNLSVSVEQNLFLRNEAVWLFTQDLMTRVLGPQRSLSKPLHPPDCSVDPSTKAGRNRKQCESTV